MDAPSDQARRAVAYIRVSSRDQGDGQSLDAQERLFRKLCKTRGWEIYRRYIDLASASDLAYRVQWRQLQDDGAKGRFKVVLVFKLDRAFRSVKHMHDTLAVWELVGVSFKSLREQFDTSTALGRLLLKLLAALAEFELDQIAIDIFLDTLAEVALAIAARRASEAQSGE